MAISLSHDKIEGTVKTLNQMLQIRRRFFIGIIVCGAAYFGTRWLIQYLKPVDPKPDPVSSRNKRIRKSGSRTSQSLRSVSLNSLAGIDGATTIGSMSSWTHRTSNQVFYDVEPNLHFFKIYQDQLAIVDKIPMPRTDRSIQLLCESQDEFLSKVSCLRYAFQDILYEKENCYFFINSGKEILRVLLSNSPDDLDACLNAYDKLLEYVADERNHEDIAREISQRRIPVLSFYDLVVDYIILESLDDLENPPAVVSSIVSNTWVSAKFRQSACHSAVTTALKYKRSQLKIPNGFFAHFYSVLDSLSPTLAWGFLGSDEDLRFKCDFLKESLLGLCRDYFSFDCVRYTSYQDLESDIMTVTRERYCDLSDRLSL